MALNKALEELLKQIKDDSERESSRKIFEKYEFFNEKFQDGLRQSDYDRYMNSAKADREKEQQLVAQYQQETSKWKEWAAKNIPKHEDLVKNYGELERKNQELQTAVEEATAKAASKGEGEGNVIDEATLTARVNAELSKRKYVDEATVQRVTGEQAKKMIDEQVQILRDGFYKQDFPNAIAFMSKLSNLQWQHRDEFKEPLDDRAFAKFMADKKVDDADQAYQMFTSEKREAKKIEEIKKSTRDEMEKEYASKFNLPGSGAPAMPELGVLEARARGKSNADIPADAEIGDNRAAYAAAAELRASGKF